MKNSYKAKILLILFTKDFMYLHHKQFGMIVRQRSTCWNKTIIGSCLIFLSILVLTIQWIDIVSTTLNKQTKKTSHNAYFLNKFTHNLVTFDVTRVIL